MFYTNYVSALSILSTRQKGYLGKKNLFGLQTFPSFLKGQSKEKNEGWVIT